MATTRLDGRESNQMRPPSMELRPLFRSDGSARFSLGHSSAIAAVYGPREPKLRSREIFDRAAIEVIVRPRVGIPGPEEKKLEGHLMRQLEHVVMHSEYPRTQITIIVQLCSDGGSLGAVASNAAFLALLDAGVALHSTVLSVAVGVRFGNTETPADALLLDPTEVEERECDVVVALSVDCKKELLVSSLSTGSPLDAIAWAGCCEAGSKACKVLEAFLRMSLEKRMGSFLTQA
mmetsp:Transcript_105862/g.167050  ORF Transcript_105862/g.167050 Transcript_105862/m.167050 type:complete len:234 (-) Transcript_105862:21-722(-)